MPRPARCPITRDADSAATSHLTGWAEAVEALRPLASTVRLEPGRVSRADRGACEVLVDLARIRATWGADVVAAAAGDPTAPPCTGDWVVLAHWPDARVTVEAVLPRRTAVVRLQVGGSSQGQVLAANIDVVAVVEPLVPDPDLGRIERLLALAWGSGAEPVVLLTKADLGSHAEAIREEVAVIAPGVPVVTLSAARGDGVGELPSLLGLRQGRTVALLGASGVGKSTLLNTLVGDTVMGTRELRSDGRGRHTTVTRELHLLPSGGAVIDTPGLRSVGLRDGEGLERAFEDVEALALACRFTDCAHGTEPGCAVQAAISAGDLPERRLDSWRRLQREAAREARRTDRRLQQLHSRQIRTFSRQVRASHRAPWA